MWTHTRRSLAAGLVGALISVIFGLLVTWQAHGAGYRFFFLASGTAGLLCGALLWRLLPEQQPRWRVIWGALAGGLSGLCAHYVTWLLVLWAARLCFGLTGGCTGSLGEPPVNFLQAFWGAAVFSFFSLVLFGWLTVILGGAAGGLLALLWFGPARTSSVSPDSRRG